MQHRQFKNIKQDVSVLGMGVMRLLTDENGKVDENSAINLIRSAIDLGIDYIDTAYTYHGGGA